MSSTALIADVQEDAGRAVAQTLMQQPDVRDCAVVGLPDDKWGERVVAVLQEQADRTLDPESLKAFVKERIGSVKTPKQIEIWLDLPRSKVGKVLKTEIKASLDPLGTPSGPALVHRGPPG